MFSTLLKFITVFLTGTLLWLSACSPPDSKLNGQQQTESTTDQPNILVILADDAGWGDFGFMGAADLETPHLDKLATSGTIFTQAYVSASVCSPSRAGLQCTRNTLLAERRDGNCTPRWPQAD